SSQVEVVSTFQAYDDTNSVRVTQSVKNRTDDDLCLELANTIGISFYADPQEIKNWYFHKFTNYRYTESLPDLRSFHDLALNNQNAVFHVENVGHASSFENLPQGILENRNRGEFLMFQIESYYDWFYEITADHGLYHMQLGGPTAVRHAWNKVLKPNQSYQTVPVAFAYGTSLNQVAGEMTKYRRHIMAVNESDKDLPAIYNEYMHYSWDSPNQDRTRETAVSVAKSGCDYYVIDCGWYNSVDWDGKIYRAFGTWHEDLGRFPEGIKKTAEFVNSLGMKFGLWIGPEVVGKDNQAMIDYYGDEGFLTRYGKKISHGTGYLLDFRNPKVRDYMSKTIDRMVEEYGCDYIKFDGCPNPGLGTDKNSTSLGDGLEESILAFLDWTKQAMERHPHVIFEDCFGGGMRMDYQALSLFSLISTSDQTKYNQYPYITSNIFVSVLPEQAAVWSYPVDDQEYDKEHEENTDRNVSEERVVLNMVNAILGRIHLASRIQLLNETKQGLIREGIEVYKKLTPEKKIALPYLPKGYASVGDTFCAVGLKTEQKAYLAVWNLSGERDVTLQLPEISVKRANVLYPQTLPTDFSYDETSLTVHFTADEQARIFEIDLY
ncbi:MAG: alpha-galactosidase, partial [Clostridia bacterium]|nr:alpha-galactosidase [Clostridia bacterium]